MGWTGTPTWNASTVPTASDLNTYVRDNELWEKGTGETFTERDVLLMATAFSIEATAPELRHVFTGAPGGSHFRMVADCQDATLANGQKLQVDFVAGERDGGTEENLVRFEVERLAANTGSFAIFIWTTDVNGNQVLSAFPAFKIDASGHVMFNKSSGSYACNVGGSARAAEYRLGGASIGKWVIVGDTMTYTGSAEVSGTWTAESAEVDSETKCTDINAEKLRGKTWPTELKAVTTAAVPVPATGAWYDPDDPLMWTTLLEVTIPAGKGGYYELIGRGQVAVNSVANLGVSARFHLDCPGVGDTPGFSGPFNYGVAGSASEIVPVNCLGRARLEAGEIVKLRACNTSEAQVLMHAEFELRFLADEIDSQLTGVSIPISVGTMTSAVI